MKVNHFSNVIIVLQTTLVSGFAPLPVGNRLMESLSWSSSYKSTIQQNLMYTSHNQKVKKTNLQASPYDIVSAFYTQALLTNPLETKLATGGVLALAGDAIAQSRDEDSDYDVKRAGAFVSFDILYRAVQCALFPEIIRSFDGHYLASFTDLIPAIEANRDVLATMEQTMGKMKIIYRHQWFTFLGNFLSNENFLFAFAVNQFLVIPFIYYPVFFSLTGYIQGLSIDATIERASTTIIPLLKRNWTFWLPVQYFQFGYVDEPLQIPFLCVVGLAWTFILSIFAGSVKNYDAEEDEDLVVVMDGGLTLETSNMGEDKNGISIDEEVKVSASQFQTQNVTVSM